MTGWMKCFDNHVAIYSYRCKLSYKSIIEIIDKREKTR